jgi:hypothetical protein
MRAVLNCPCCATRLKVASRQVGKLVDCPKCRTLFVCRNSQSVEGESGETMSVDQAALRSVDWDPAEALPPAAQPAAATVSMSSAANRTPAAPGVALAGGPPASPWSSPVRPSSTPTPPTAPQGLPVAYPASTPAPAVPPLPTPTWASSPAISLPPPATPQAQAAPQSSYLPPAALPIASPAAPAVTQSTLVPRFKAADPVHKSPQLGADGKLPELSLIEAQKVGKSTAEAKKSRTWLVYTGLALSMFMSITLATVDVAPSLGNADEKNQAVQEIRNHFAPEGRASLQPYQVALREAERARQRGDRDTQAAYLRRVLELLRTEGRRGSLTGYNEEDKKLENAIAVLLRSDW